MKEDSVKEKDCGIVPSVACITTAFSAQLFLGRATEGKVGEASKAG